MSKSDIRKVSGASRTALTAQFLGEGIVQALLALCIATMMVELSLPSVNAFLQSGAVFDYWRDPVLAASLLAGAVMVGALAGAYPAMVLSAFQPAVVLKGLILGVGRTVLIRQLLVGLQFVILIVLIAASVIVFEQYRFAIREALRVKTDQMMFVRDQKCDTPVRGRCPCPAGCAGRSLFQSGDVAGVRLEEIAPSATMPGPFPLHLVSVGIWTVRALRPQARCAGRFFSRDVWRR